MKLHLVTIGQPKLEYARRGWEEYWERLSHYHQLRATHIPDKHNDANHLRAATKSTYIVALAIEGREFSSPELAQFLNERAIAAQEVSFIIGGPDGLPSEALQTADYRWSLGKLTLPHDLAMITVLETLYRASTINAGHPYHR
jgi:23S rRNA (pseudouridine1915-N3)-methyltransferase